MDGVGWLLQNCVTGIASGGILGDEMGLGKTCQIVTALACCETWGRREELRSRDLPSCVVVPKSLLLNWEHEIRRFLSEDQICCVV